MDECIFYKKIFSGSIIIFGVYVDDNIVVIFDIFDDLKWWSDFMDCINKKWGLKDLGILKWCLGINVNVDE